MGRILAFDFGSKRIGVAVTDPDQIIATALGTFSPESVWPFLVQYVASEKVELFVAGMPRTLDNRPAEPVPQVNEFIRKLQARFPDIPVETYDERFTSKIAFRAMIEGGVKKSDRRNKALIDQVSAVIILQDVLANRGFRRDRSGN